MWLVTLTLYVSVVAGSVACNFYNHVVVVFSMRCRLK